MRLFLVIIILAAINTTAYSAGSYIGTVWTRQVQDSIIRIKFTKDGKYLYSQSKDSSLIKWEVSNGNIAAKYTIPPNSDFDPDAECYYDLPNFSNYIYKVDFKNQITKDSFYIDLSWSFGMTTFYISSKQKLNLSDDYRMLFINHTGTIVEGGVGTRDGGGCLYINTFNGQYIDKCFGLDIIFISSKNAKYFAYHTRNKDFHDFSIQQNSIGYDDGVITIDSAKEIPIIDEMNQTININSIGKSNFNLFAFTDTGGHLLGYYNNIVRIWDSNTGRQSNMTDSIFLVYDSKFDKYDSLVYILCSKGIFVYNMKCLQQDSYIDKETEMNCLATSPNSTHFAVASGSGYVRMLKNDYYKGLFLADFYSDYLQGTDSLAVKFFNFSLGEPDKYSWDFGDGIKSNEENPSHKYKSPGLYSIRLTIEKKGIEKSITKENYIRVYEYLKADFIADKDTCPPNENILFTDKSIKKPIKWKWEFGDGENSFEQNPTHQYYKEGAYSVKLTVYSKTKKSTEIKTQYINILRKLSSNIYADIQEGYAPLKVSFSDISSGNPTEYYWDFGDGFISESRNPIHYYNLPGEYNVKHIITKNGKKDTLLSKNHIKVIKNDTLPIQVTNAKLSHCNGILNIKYSRDGKYIVTLGGDSTIKIWNNESLELVNEQKLNKAGKSLYISRDNQRLLVAVDSSSGLTKCFFVYIYSFPEMEILNIIIQPINTLESFLYINIDETENNNEFFINLCGVYYDTYNGSLNNYCFVMKPDKLSYKIPLFYNGYNILKSDKNDVSLFIMRRKEFKVIKDIVYREKINQVFYYEGNIKDTVYFEHYSTENDTIPEKYYENPMIFMFSPNCKYSIIIFDKIGIQIRRIENNFNYDISSDVLKHPVECAAFDFNDAFVFIIDKTGQIFSINPFTQEVFKKVYYESIITNWKMDCSPISNQFATGSSDGVLRIWSYDENYADVVNSEKYPNKLMEISPNPAGEYIHLEINQPKECNTSIVLTDITGNIIREIFAGQLPAGNRSFYIDTEKLSSGFYLANYTSAVCRQAITVVVVK